MKKINLLSVFIILSLFLIPSVFALNTNVKTLPNKPFIYWLTIIIPEEIDMFFTFNQQDKLIKHTLIAEKRLVEIQMLNQINIQIPQSTINNYNGRLDKIEEMINRGIITSEEARQIIENNLNRVKNKEKEIPSDLIPLPIIIGKDSCSGISGQKCQEGYRCTCDFSQDCKYDQVGQCVKGKAEDIGNKIKCPMIYDPVCGRDGNTYPSECVAKQRGASILKKGQCEEKTKEECKEVCLYTGTTNEGMYDSCSRKLIVLKQCDFSNEKPIVNPNPEPPLEICNSDKICQDKYRSCYSKCLNGKCGEIMTFVALPDYPNCDSYGVL